jgi:hypothetical protein
MQLRTCKYDSKVREWNEALFCTCKHTNNLTKHYYYLLLTSDTSLPEGFHTHLGLHWCSLNSGCDDETTYLVKMRDNICYYANHWHLCTMHCRKQQAKWHCQHGDPLHNNRQESMEQEHLIHKWWSIHLAVLDELWEKVVWWIIKSWENGKIFLLLSVSAAANTLSSIK